MKVPTDDAITDLEPDILECEVKWALASEGDTIPVELFQILKDDAVKVLHSICQQIWKTQQWPQDCVLDDGGNPAQPGGLSPLLMPAQATSSTCLA